MPEVAFAPLRKVVMCFDGTGNEISKPHTNVYRIFRATDQPGVLRFYHPGVNTLVDEAKLYKGVKIRSWIIDSMTGASMRIAFIEGYKFLINNVQDGDDIYFFGFSRGSYAARMVAGAVKMFGIPRPEHACLVPFIWQAYIGAALRPSKDENTFQYAARIKRDFSREVTFRMRFMGVWDTVSSFGFISAFKAVPFTRENPDISVVRHAVAVDERRSVFSINEVETKSKDKDKDQIPDQDVEQVWFSGCHCDVGGGHTLEESGLSMIPYRWMLDEVKKHGLTFNQKVLDEQFEPFSKTKKGCVPDHLGKLHESMDAMYGFIEMLPLRKFDFDSRGWKWQWPNWFRRRTIDPGDTIHESVTDRMNDDSTYRPKNVKL